MNKKHIFIYLFMALPALLLTSCLHDQDDTFSDSASARMSKYIQHVDTVLTSAANGWVLNYYPDREQSYGGYVYTLKFDGQNVQVRSELDKPTDVFTSTYKLISDNGPILTFDTYNEAMHFFATPSSSQYEAYDGDFEFIILGVSDDHNTITLKGKRSGNIMYMYRQTDYTAEQYLDSIGAIKSAMSGMKQIITVVGTDTVAVANAGSALTFSYIEDGAEKTEVIPVHYTLEGMAFFKPITFFGQTVNGIKYVDGEDKLPAFDNDKIIFEVIILPLNEQVVNGQWYVAYSQLGSYAQPYWDKFKEGTDAEGEIVGYAYFGTLSTGGFGMQFTSGRYRGEIYMDYKLTGEDEITMAVIKDVVGDGNGKWYWNNAYLNYAMFPFGYTTGKTFKLTAPNPKFPTQITLTDTANDKNVITLSGSQVTAPFDK
jgi:hypothetical protein